MKASFKTFRLPKTVVPRKYDISFHPNPTGKSGRFHGEETITLKVLEDTPTIALNVCDLAIKQATITRGGKTLAGKVSIDKENEIATIDFGAPIKAGRWKLYLRFTGTHNHKLRGWYKSKWSKDGVEHTIVSTQHESKEARKTFPCFDEPSFKAKFKIQMVIDKALVARSNGEVLREKSISRRKKLVQFATTPKMSTYLTACVVGEFVSSQPIFVNGKEIRIWTVPGKEHLTGWALKCAAFAVQWYEWYYGVPYFGGKKIDHIAIPEFEAGAMENTSCVTYREERILCDEATASHAELESIATTIFHESAHFWFGDLVTMLWWNGLWLNESFATFMENLCLSFWKPEYRIWDTFGLSRAGAMKIDGLKSTHPIEVAINHPDEVDEIFDAISYEKGGSVLDMLHQFIGFEVFRKGIQIYLKRHALSNTETNDLWDAVANSCRLAKLAVPVGKMMTAWIFTPGHPVISAKEGDKPSSIEISQQQFRYLAEGISTTLWPVPIIYQVKAADGCVSEHKVILNGPSLTLTLPVDYQWIKLNAGGSGFFRVRYDPRLIAKLTANVQENLSAIERFNLVGDAWACVQAGLTSSVDFLQMVPLFAGETNPNVMNILLSALSALHRITPEAKQESLKNIIADFLNPTFDKLGWAPQAGESIQTTELRASILMTLGTICGDQTVRTKAVEMFDEWVANKSTLDPNLLGKVVLILAYWGGPERYQQFYGLWRAAATPNEEGIFLFALAKFRDAELLGKTLTLSMSGDVSDQDAPALFSGLLANRFSQTFAWQYLRDNWEKVKAAFPVNMVPRIARSCASLDNEVQSAEVRAFFAVHELKAGAMAIAQMLEQLEIAVRFRQSETDRLAEYLK